MARLHFIPPPESLNDKPYKHCRDWLKVNFYKELCSYCLLQNEDNLHIDHFVPQSYAPHRINDPSNLLLSCPRCNSGKLDYHPNYHERRRLSKEKHGYGVIDIREEDFSDLYELKEDGLLCLKPGPQKDRAKFNIKLLRFDIPSFIERRRNCLKYVAACEDLIGVNNIKAQRALNTLVAECAERYLFLKAFNVQVSDHLRELIENHIAINKPKFYT
jgi:uncharacterized protein (TIGR02646 family)